MQLRSQGQFGEATSQADCLVDGARTGQVEIAVLLGCVHHPLQKDEKPNLKHKGKARDSDLHFILYVHVPLVSEKVM